MWLETLALWVKLSADILEYLFFPENRFWHYMQIVSIENRSWYYMQIVSIGDNLHVMSKPVFWEK